ncbi:MAG: hypothetical protein K6B14_05160 [Lachnospiraceae bacterium]|nr:hypothetical protein [Lachnospiraceae bacterium]
MKMERFMVCVLVSAIMIGFLVQGDIVVNAKPIYADSVTVTEPISNDVCINIYYKGAKKITKKQAEKAINKELERAGETNYYIVDTIKKKNKIIVWVKWTQTQTFSKYVINRKTGKAKRYSIYVGYDMADPNFPPSVEYTFNVKDYL